MLQFQRKHSTAFSQVLNRWRVSEMDLQEQLSIPADWLTSLYDKLKTLEASTIRDPDHQRTFFRLIGNTLHMLQQLILRGRDLKESVEQDSSKHVTSVLLKLPTETVIEPHLFQKLSNIQDDWIKKQDQVTLYTKRKRDHVPFQKRYRSTQINLYVSKSAIILTSSSDETVENSKTFCSCYDRNYADVAIIDAKSRESWMPEREHLFKLWIYEKDGIKYQQYEYVIGLNSDRSMKDLLEWKSALVVATGESGIFDDYRRPTHIVTESFITDRKGELHLEIDDIVEILEMQIARDETWVKGMRLSDKKTGWFPRNKLGHEVDSEYSIGQEVKLRYRRERERRNDQGWLQDFPEVGPNVLIRVGAGDPNESESRRGRDSLRVLERLSRGRSPHDE
ncbi:rho guanine nucleotide exchange factor 5-like isoform X2 [Anneissia japonica]|uniref:rho guanine nucleotide exchange factor 5-like isoform X2 n=1 Tax=Anneissia japonica TaxID=1529436 RepID=UPI001425B16F|nr:rho guanine nucleotide exchange factor 5-like isoform X2 [Anneissia japonica]